ncbi:hypothetical protein DL98DRAFT_590496 [Cadophora sp. DSE1049]|nr:hypothetical protein DL98DRAFT_590496 [Cadophora sp. DSE1049]
MSSPSSTPDSTPPFSSSLTTMEAADYSAQKASSPTLHSSRTLKGMSGAPVPESSQERVQAKMKVPSLRRPQSVVTVITGSEDAKKSFMIHKDIICHHSSYFAKAFNGKLLESKTQTMSLPNVDSDTFGLLVEWFYTQKIDIDPKNGVGDKCEGLHVWMSDGHLPERLLIDIIMSLQKDHVHGLEPTMKFGTFGSAKEYYVGGAGEKVVVPKVEK